MSTKAPASGAQVAPISARRIFSVSFAPALTEPSLVSVRTSDRLIFSSTKYGPSVNSGRTMQAGILATLAVVAVEAASAAVLVAAATAVAVLVACAAVVAVVVA